MVNDKFISVARAGVILKTDRKSPWQSWFESKGISVSADWRQSPPPLYVWWEDRDNWKADEAVKVCDLVHDPSISSEPCFSSYRVRESDVHDFLERYAADPLAFETEYPNASPPQIPGDAYSFGSTSTFREV